MGSLGMRTFAHCAVVCLALVFGIAACSPLYGSKPEKLKNPEKKKKPPEAAEASDSMRASRIRGGKD